MHYQKRYPKANYTSWFDASKQHVVESLLEEVNGEELLKQLSEGKVVHIPHTVHVFCTDYRIRELNKIYVETVECDKATQA
jgi:hypothetical protein